LRSLDEEAEDNDLTRSEYVRNLLRNRHEPNENTERLRSQIAQYESELENIREQNEKLSNEVNRLENEKEQLREELENEIDRLKNKNRMILEERNEKKELVKYAEDTRTTEQRWRQASLPTRLKWKLTGMPEQNE
jgi:septal ring factor EnvC (AmiA/AmiB activator)